MKKYLFIFAALMAVGCSKNVVPSVENTVGNDSEYVLYAEDVTTKTTTDDSFNVRWTDEDNLAVYTWPVETALPTDVNVWRSTNPVNFVAVPGSGSPKPFLLSETDDPNSLAEIGNPYSGRLNAFRERFGDGTADLKWGVIYPGKMANASRVGQGIVVFGDETKVRTKQNGNNNMDHLQFQDVLWGTAQGSAPTVKMKHLGTMMVYTVNNATASPLTVKSITISVPSANIGGEIRFNVFDGTWGEPMTALHETTLWVDNGTEIPAGGSADFYQVLAPFTLAAGKTVSMTVETDNGFWTKAMTADADVVFESGKKNNASLNIDAIKENVVLTKHDIAEQWFSTDSNLGRYLDMTNGNFYSFGNNFNQADIDIVVFRGSSKTALTFAAPTDSDLQDYIDNSIKSWNTINATKIKKVAVDFDAEIKLFDLKSLYDAAPGEGERCVLAMDETAIVKTADSNYALIKVTGGTKYDQAWGSFALSLKTVE